MSKMYGNQSLVSKTHTHTHSRLEKTKEERKGNTTKLELLEY